LSLKKADYNAYGIYHSSDYPFSFFNIRQNAAERIEHYFSGKSGN
jgi:hypothetical protein